jgi:tRNA U34 5-carboxymethylaminomethyl modifying enzyme MnmG/GidA
MAKTFEEINDILKGYMPKTNDQYPGMPPYSNLDIPETMDYGSVPVKSEEPIKIEVEAKPKEIPQLLLRQWLKKNQNQT